MRPAQVIKNVNVPSSRSVTKADPLDEARRIFVENLIETLQTIASDAKIQVELNPEAVSRYRLLGYENRCIADHRFRDDTVDAGEIGTGHEVTALYEIKLHETVGKRDLLATLRLRYRSKATGEVVEAAVDLSRKSIARQWDSASPALQLISVVTEFAEILKGTYWSREGSLDGLEQRAADVATHFCDDRECRISCPSSRRFAVSRRTRWAATRTKDRNLGGDIDPTIGNAAQWMPARTVIAGLVIRS